MDTNAVPPRRGAPSTTSTLSAAVSAVPVDELAAPVGVSFAVADQVLAALVVVSFVAADVVLAVPDAYSSVVDTDEKLLGMIHSYCARRNIYHESSRLPGGKRTPLLTDSTTNHPDSSNNY